ncbi:MAG: putative zinc-binding metallopeptidase [Oleibacter sp.]|nr:putative zinc-binding metallopeptidase [Thalassolituus sp.]
MRRFTCDCGNAAPLFFENFHCVSCNNSVGYCFLEESMKTLKPTQTAGLYLSNDKHYRTCANRQEGVCNGVIEIANEKDMTGKAPLCFACHFNDNIPDLKIPSHIELWRRLEKAKRRLLQSLMALRLPLPDKQQSPEGLSFSFMTDKKASDHFRTPITHSGPVFTGHAQGDITINLAEADDVARHRMREDMGEQYRTLLGHFRHEIGHFYWDVLIRDDAAWLAKFRSLFGDPDLSYQEALERHYHRDPNDTSWQSQYISAYATMHPWEDWAETFAHYLHMIDTIETARSWGLQSHSGLRSSSVPVIADMPLPQDANVDVNFELLLENWLHFSVILNALNRSMGTDDAYPFVVVGPVQQKLKMIHELLRAKRMPTKQSIVSKK